MEFKKAPLLELLAAKCHKWQKKAREDTAAIRYEKIAKYDRSIAVAEETINNSRQAILKLRMQEWDYADPEVFASCRVRELEKAIEHVSASANSVFSSDDDLLKDIL